MEKELAVALTVKLTVSKQTIKDSAYFNGTTQNVCTF